MYHAKEWKDAASTALKQSGDWISGAGSQASELAMRAARHAHKVYPRLVSQASALGSQARGRILAFSVPIGASVSDTSHEIGDSLRTTGRWGMRLGGIYLIAKLLCPRDSTVRKTQEAVESHIRNEPVESALIAAGLGFMLARLLR